MKKDQIKEPPFTVVNGRKRYRMSNAGIRCIADCHPSHDIGAVFREPVEGNDHRQDPGSRSGAGAGATVNSQANGLPDDAPPAEGPGEAPEGGSGGNADELRMLVRVLSAAPTWSCMGWLGPQLVDNGYNDAYALRKMPGFITQRQTSRPVGFVWDHSFSIKDKAGRLENGAWEEPTGIEAGCNAVAVIRRAYDPKACLGLEGGEINAMSVAWDPDFEMSHPDMDFGTFVEMQGREVDGEIVCWRPVDLAAEGVLHLGMVWAGADANAGPRDAQNKITNAAGAAQDFNHGETGGGTIMEKLIALCAAVLGVLGIEYVFDEKGTVTDGLVERTLEKLNGLTGIRDAYNALAAKLQAMEKALRTEGESAVALAQIVERIPARLELATAGEQYIEDLKQAALKAFDSAKVDPSRPDLSDEAKQIRAVIGNCTDIGQLKAYCAEYGAQADARFGRPQSRRTSLAEDPATGSETPLNPEQKRAAASVAAWQKGGK